jgi:SAM-dependent methyltransferase
VELLLSPHATLDPSPWVQRWAHLIRRGGTVLDVACGSGRHVRWLHARGFDVTGVDRDATAIDPLRVLGTMVVADIERDPWPLPGRTFDAVIVTNYLWRGLLPTIVASVATGGVLIYETFAAGNERFGKPSSPDFLLQPGELLWACATLQVVAYEDGLLEGPPRRVQRIAARRQAPDAAPLEFAP